eukprot:symbB.v1.2.012880.t1/scaffold876.1/size155678/5
MARSSLAFCLTLAFLWPGVPFMEMDVRSRAEEMLRKKVCSVRKKWELLGSYSREQTEEVLAKFQLPKDLAARCHVQEGATWLDAMQKLGAPDEGSDPVAFWRKVEEHPIAEYVHVQCQSCGRRVPDAFPASEEPGLTEEEPSEEEKTLVRSGWFRGPRGPVVFVYRCPECQYTSRWFRSSHPEITLNPQRWGRLCGEQEDLKVWLAKYFGIQLRVCVPLDWDHVWTEIFDGCQWIPLDRNCLHFARRLNENIGAWTHVLAIGQSATTTEEVTEAYLRHADGTEEEVAGWREQISRARADATGQLTQSKTHNGYFACWEAFMFMLLVADGIFTSDSMKGGVVFRVDLLQKPRGL